MDLCIQRFLLLEVYFTTFLSPISNQCLPKNAKNVVSASYPDDYPGVSLSKKMPSVPFPWSLAVHHQSLASGWLYICLLSLKIREIRGPQKGRGQGGFALPRFFVRNHLHGNGCIITTNCKNPSPHPQNWFVNHPSAPNGNYLSSYILSLNPPPLA